MTTSIDATIVFQKNWEALTSFPTRFISNQGSSRSSKTYSICQCLILYGLQNPNKTISIVRKTLPALRATAMRDFFEVLTNMDIYSKDNHNKTDNLYKLSNGTMFEFFSTDDEQKLRGRKRDICWINEANELYYDDFNQLNLRTTDKIILDFNPSDATSWIYDLPIDDTCLIKSTYKDNPFLEDSIKRQIENLKQTDEALWSIYGLGERCASRKNIYTNWIWLDSKPERFTKYVLGTDFGYNHPTAIVKVWYNENELFIEPILYQSYLTTPELIECLKSKEISVYDDMMCDYSRPEIIAELQQANFNAKNANKNVKNGITNVKTYTIYALENKELHKEYDNYQWRKVGDTITDEPTKQFDDYMDAIRYAVYQIKDFYSEGSGIISFY